jgi:HSP20 family protein
MSLIKWNPEAKFFPAANEWMDDVLDTDFIDKFMPKVKGVSLPAINVSETDKMFKMEVAAPGFNKEDFVLEVKDGFLTISGENKAEKTEKDEKYSRREFWFNSFTRSFTLPENVDQTKIAAKYDKGVLMVSLPKMKTGKEVPTKKIAIS